MSGRVRSILPALALLAAVPAAAQTCGGSLRLDFSEERPSGRAPTAVPARRLVVTAEAFLGDPDGLRTADEARRDPNVEAEPAERLGATPGSRLSTNGTTLRVRTGCGLALVRLRVTHRGRVMTLDVVRAPNHVATELDAPVPFRPGRFVLDLWTARRVSAGGSPRVYSASAVRPAGE